MIAERLAIYNVPTVIWFDEDDRIVRPPVMAPVDDLFKDFTNVDSTVHHEQLRAWVNDGTLPFDENETRNRIPAPTEDEVLARAERRMGAHLYRLGKPDRAAVHFAHAAELAPMDFTIRRGTLPAERRRPVRSGVLRLLGRMESRRRPRLQQRRPRRLNSRRPTCRRSAQLWLRSRRYAATIAAAVAITVCTYALFISTNARSRISCSYTK